MKTLKTLIFILFISQIALGQESEKSFIIKTHPFAYLLEDYNIGFEFGKTKNLHYNVGVFATHNLSNFDVYTLFRDKTKGATIRLGVKSFHKRWYAEPQIRFAKTSTIESATDINDKFFYDVTVKRKTFQLCLLGGYQIQTPKSAFVFDTYLGLGVASFNSYESKYTAHIDPSQIGKVTNFKYPKSNVLFYFGTSIGFDVKKIKNKK
jgi:hypothetical protein